MNLFNKLDWAVKHSKNCLLTGPHGTGKTSIVKEVFEKNGLKYLYFSASTLDPWLHIQGIPREKKLENGTSVIHMVRPEALADGTVEAIMIDEINRAPKGVLNALLELILNKSINGLKFPNLKVVFAAQNPPDEQETYNVEAIDPAMADRFDMQFNVPNVPDRPYFVKKYGEGLAKSFIAWHKELPDNEKKKISPRRLDMACAVYSAGGDLHDVLVESSNISKLLSSISNGPITEKLEILFQNKDLDGAQKLLVIENNYESALEHLRANPEWKEFFYKVLPKEKISVLMSKSTDQKFFMEQLEFVPLYQEVAAEIVQAKQSMGTVNKLRSRFVTIQQNNPNFKLDPDIASKLYLPNLNANGFSFDKSLSDMKTEADTYKRGQMVKELAEETDSSKLVSEADCLKALETVNYYVGRSYDKTVKDNQKNIEKVVTQVTLKLFQDSKVKSKTDLTDLFSKSFPNLKQFEGSFDVSIP